MAKNRKTTPESSPAPQAAPEAASGGSVDTEAVTTRIAKHELLDASGKVVETEEEATGIRYILLSTGETFDHQSGLPAGEGNTMVWCFGAKTLATNEASAVRQKDPAGDQIGGIRERFGIIFPTDGSAPKWVDRTRDGVGVKIDKAVLAEAATEVSIRGGKFPESERAMRVAKLLAKLEANAANVTLVRQVDGVAAEYARRIGKATKTIDDLANLMS